MSQMQNDQAKQKLLLYLNDALSIENASSERLNIRIGEVSLENTRNQLQHHQQETKEHQERLKQLISHFGGTPTEERADLSTPMPPESMINRMMESMTVEEKELKRAKEDLILENAEAAGYKMLILLGQKMNVDTTQLEKSLKEEQDMANWIDQNTPDMINQLWPRIETSIGKGTVAA